MHYTASVKLRGASSAKYHFPYKIKSAARIMALILMGLDHALLYVDHRPHIKHAEQKFGSTCRLVDPQKVGRRCICRCFLRCTVDTVWDCTWEFGSLELWVVGCEGSVPVDTDMLALGAGPSCNLLPRVGMIDGSLISDADYVMRVRTHM